MLRLRQDPYVAALMAGELINRDKGRIEQRIGRDLSTAELYFAHFLGTASAGRFLALTAEKPGQVAKQVFKAAAKANRSLFTEKAGKGRRSLTVAEVREKIGGMIDRRLDRYEGVAALAAPELKSEVTLTEIETDAAPVPAPGRARPRHRGDRAGRVSPDAPPAGAPPPSLTLLQDHRERHRRAGDEAERPEHVDVGPVRRLGLELLADPGDAPGSAPRRRTPPWAWKYCVAGRSVSW